MVACLLNATRCPVRGPAGACASKTKAGLRMEDAIHEKGGPRGPPRGHKVGMREWMPVGHPSMRRGGRGRAPGSFRVGTRQRLPVGRVHVPRGGLERAPESAAVGAGQRMLVELDDVRAGGRGRAPGGAQVGGGERVPMGCMPVRDGGDQRGPHRGRAVGRGLSSAEAGIAAIDRWASLLPTKRTTLAVARSKAMIGPTT
jgi:hypothetical protein